MTWSIEQIDSYIEGLIVNAEQLISESRLLLDGNAYARSFSLAHFAREELAKVGMLEAAGTRLLAGHKVDFRKLSKRLTDHKEKLRSESADTMIMAAGAGVSDLAEIIAKFGSQMVNYRNDNKNSSLYVGIIDGVVARPHTLFSREKAERTLKLAEFSLKEHQAVRNLLGPYAQRAPISIPEVDSSTMDLSSLDIAELGKLKLQLLSIAESRSKIAEESEKSSG
ncbi:AbiV family abortive infection protein [Pseudomonas sp. NPDC008258]|uniref:AbiV family abortive infection protein n=1 Tax=Pseudomonas sp. NPDC008258 TaxID=3364418 RepID=UPI0036E35087